MLIAWACCASCLLELAWYFLGHLHKEVYNYQYIAMKRIFFVVALFLTIPTLGFAASGACSGHGGVSCGVGPDGDGSVICNDGWRGSSVKYSSMVMCRGYESGPKATPLPMPTNAPVQKTPAPTAIPPLVATPIATQAVVPVLKDTLTSSRDPKLTPTLGSTMSPTPSSVETPTLTISSTPTPQIVPPVVPPHKSWFKRFFRFLFR